MGKINYKIFLVDNVEKVLMVLSSLIRDVIVDLDKYRLYHNELLSMIISYIKNSTKEELDNNNVVIPEKEYFDIKDKIMYRQMLLLKIIADEQKTSFSYKNFRKFIKDKGYIKNSLSVDVNNILNELLKLRNWTFHNTQSNFFASSEVIKNNIPKEWGKNAKIEPMLNPVIIDYYENVSLEEAISYYYLLEKRISDFEKILVCMKQDYIDVYKSSNLSKGGYNVTFFSSDIHLTNLNDVQFLVRKIEHPIDIYGQAGQISQLSMAIQKSKYDGTQESLNEILSVLKSKTKE